jgi:putative hydroxymethylpyrimidine transport system substrate-binding protein
VKRLPLLVVVIVIASIALAPGLTGCGEKSEEKASANTESLRLMLDFYPNADHAGIYMAEQLGYFADAGLDVSIHTPADPAAPIKQVAAGQTDLAISYEPEVLLAHAEGLDVVAVGAVVDRPLTSLIWLKKSGIRSIADLRGKSIGTAGIPYQTAYLKTILARVGLTLSDVETFNTSYSLLPALVGDRAQAIFGGFSNIEGIDLRLRGKDPVVTPVDRLGVPTYDELVLVANRSRLEDDPETIRLFLGALARGTAAAIEAPDAATQALLDANRELDPKLTRAEVDATLPLLSKRGTMDPAEWRAFIAWMQANGLISDRPTTAQVLSNAYLAGQIPD